MRTDRQLASDDTLFRYFIFYIYIFFFFCWPLRTLTIGQDS